MTLTAGTHLGSYELVAQIGAGGMGEVYQAHDSKLGRDVAIKVLPEAFAHDPERLSRFQREAKMLAALNHPNIATIYGLEQSNGTSYLVMELIGGENLAERITREGPLPVEEASAIAKQIAEALEAAHEKGIIHRDLKPANVKVTPEGKVKVLDFGLAKAFAGDTTESDPSNSPTLSQAATMHGVILGTAAYMSPEQARGKAVDKRTDIWAFGCVLFEMLTGKQAFEGKDATEILAPVVKTEPDWSRLPASAPAKVRDLLRRCLQKDRAQRMQAAGDARIEIQEALATPSVEPAATSRGLRAFGGRPVFLAAGALLLVAAIAGFAGWTLKLSPAPPAKPVTRTVIDLPPGDQLAAQDNPAIAISPDGSQIAYVAFHSGTRQIFLRALDSLDAKALAGTEGADTPFFSPDGQWLGFFAGNRLKKISVAGGGAVDLSAAPSHRGGTWASQARIFFAAIGTAIFQTSDDGGVPQPLAQLDNGETGERWPVFLSAGQSVLFATFGANPSAIAIERVSASRPARAGARQNLVPGGTSPNYASSGHLLYVQGSSLMAAPFDPGHLQVTGGAVPVVQGVLESSNGASQYGISTTGSLVYVPSADRRSDQLVWVNRNGTEQVLGAPAHGYSFLRISPDGRRLAVTISEGDDQIWLYDTVRETLSRFTFEGAANRVPIWAPDGNHLAFISDREGPLNAFWQLADGSGGLERLRTSEYAAVPGSFSPDGQLLAFFEFAPETGYDLWVLRLSDRKAQPFLRTKFNEASPVFSPDGRWLAYVSDETGRYEVYVQPYPGPGGKYQVSTEGGTEPLWNPKGKELFYRSGEEVIAVDVATQPTFVAGKPRVLFQGPYRTTSILMPFYDVSPDGQRFLMIKPSEQTSSLNQIVVVQNWTEELKQKVPTGKR